MHEGRIKLLVKSEEKKQESYFFFMSIKYLQTEKPIENICIILYKVVPKQKQYFIIYL